MRDSADNQPTIQRYEPSGQFSGILLLSPLLMAAAVFPAAWLYAWLVVETFLKEWAFTVFAAYAGYLSVTGALMSRMGNVRRPSAGFLAGVLCGAASLVISWALFVKVQYADWGKDVSVLHLIFSPDQLWREVDAIRTSGLYHTFPNGFGRATEPESMTARTVFWIFEALGIFSVPVFTFFDQARDVFCERCGRWAKKSSDALVFTHPDPSDLRKRLMSQDLSFLEKAGPAERKPSYLSLLNPGSDRKREYITIQLEWCPQCNQLHVLSAASIRQRFYLARARKRSRDKTTTLVDQMLITADAFEGLMAARERFGAFVQVDQGQAGPDDLATDSPHPETGGGASMPDGTPDMVFEPKAIEDRYGPRFYKPSGPMDASILLVPPLMLVLAYPAAWLYAWLGVKTFFGHVPWLLFFACLIYTAWANAFLIRKGKVRRPGLAMGLAGLFTVSTLLFSWSHFVHMIFAERGQEIALTRLLSSPSLLWDSMQTIRTSDWHTTLSGPFSRALCWIGEALGILLFAGVSAAACSQDVFCRRCRCWTRKEEGALLFTCSSPGVFSAKLLALEPDFLSAVSPATTEDHRYYEINTEACPKCKDFHVLNMDRYDRQWLQEKGAPREKKERTTLMENFLITAEMRAEIAAHRDRLKDFVKVDENGPRPNDERTDASF